MAKNTYSRIDPETLKEITDFVIDRLREEELETVRDRHDRKLANVKTLLRNYRSLLEHSNRAVYEAAHVEDDLDLADLLEIMSGDRRESFRVESIKNSAARTRLIMDHVNEMINLYGEWCENSGKPENERRYRVIYYMYIAPETKTVEEIAEEESLDRSTVYRDIDFSVEKLAALIFGVDGLYLAGNRETRKTRD